MDGAWGTLYVTATLRRCLLAAATLQHCQVHDGKTHTLWQPRQSAAEIQEGDAPNRVWGNGFLITFYHTCQKRHTYIETHTHTHTHTNFALIYPII